MVTKRRYSDLAASGVGGLRAQALRPMPVPWRPRGMSMCVESTRFGQFDRNGNRARHSPHSHTEGHQPHTSIILNDRRNSLSVTLSCAVC